MTDIEKQLEKERTKTPHEERHYGPLFLSVSAFLIIGTLLAIVNETRDRRPWKDFQEEFRSIEIAQTQAESDAEVERLQDPEIGAELDDIDEALREAEAEKQTEEYQARIQELQEMQAKVDEAVQDWRFARSDSDEAYYNYQHARLSGDDAAAEEKTLRAVEAHVEQAKALVDSLTAERDALQAEVGGVDARISDLERRREEFHRELSRLARKIDEVTARPLEIDQIVLAGFDFGNFGQSMIRVDRCQTCHAGITKAGFEEQPNPYKSHPGDFLEIHEPAAFGCTPCHWGQGPALDAFNAHGYDHYWPRPLLEDEYLSTSCRGCHQRAVYLEGADTMLFAKKIALDFGCHGCHEVPFLEEQEKVGPSLRRITAKTSPEWMGRWVKDPHAVYETTRMPMFYFNDEEVEAVVAYLHHVSEQEIDETGYKPALTPPGAGDAARGKELVESIGCQGCHQVGDAVSENRLKEGQSFGANLNKVGSKVDAVWLYNWLKDPKAYDPSTRMPSLRLTDQEALDITAYLMSLTDPDYDPFDVAGLENERAIQEGGRLIRTYGCHGCHDIPGMEGEGKVSVALSEIGDKNPEQEFDFGNRTDVPHEWDAWVYHKVKEPRGYTTERIISKMPDFRFTDEEARALTVLLRGFTADRIALEYRSPETPDVLALHNGRWFFRQQNCIGCHEMEGYGAYIRDLMDDENLAPPVLTGEGKKVQDDWLINFLKSPFTIRPWLHARMPTFGLDETEVTTVVEYFLAESDLWLQLDTFDDFRPDPTLVADGETLFDRLQCMKCHIVGGEVQSAGLLAPSLDIASDRLKPEWVIAWLVDPQVVQPGTMMPTFFQQDEETGEPISYFDDILDGDGRKHIEAIRDYVFTLGKTVP